MNLSVVVPLDYSVDEDCLTYLYNELISCTDNFEMILVVKSEASEIIHRCCKNLLSLFSNIKYKSIEEKKVSKTVKAGVDLCQYDLTMILNMNGCSRDLNFKDMISKFIHDNCYLWYKDNNSDEPVCVFCKTDKLKKISRLVIAYYITELLLQVAIVMCKIDKVYRVNGLDNIFELFYVTIMPRGVWRLRMEWFVLKCELSRDIF